MKEIYTIGYAGFAIDDFIAVLKKYNINSLIDVRSSPRSEFYKDYNKTDLDNKLKKSRIIYRNYKKEFGARQNNSQYYTHGYLDFNLFALSEEFRSGFEKIANAIPLGYRFVLMCSEKDPITCHRTIMVAREFHRNGFVIKNILQDGNFILQEEIEQRLVDMYYPNREQLSFFEEDQLSWEEMVKNSYSFQNEKIGFQFDSEEAYYD